jgi:hypothetical protein
VSTTISPQTRAIALAAILVALAVGLGLMALSHFQTSSKTVAPQTIKLLHPAHKQGTVQARSAHTKTAVASHHTVVTHPATKAVVVTPKHVVVHHAVVQPRSALVPRVVAPKAPLFAAPNGLPFAVARALQKHPVVVVALYQASREATAAQRRRAVAGTSAAAAVGIDQLALGEAAAGAKDAHAGFVGVDVLSQREASPLAALLGPLADPTVLVYARPATLTVQIPGFADRATVAQAAVDAAAGQ